MIAFQSTRESASSESALLICIKFTYIDELLTILTSKRLGLKIGTVFIGSPICADDVALLASSAEESEIHNLNFKQTVSIFNFI